MSVGTILCSLLLTVWPCVPVQLTEPYRIIHYFIYVHDTRVFPLHWPMECHPMLRLLRMSKSRQPIIALPAFKSNSIVLNHHNHTQTYNFRCDSKYTHKHRWMSDWDLGYVDSKAHSYAYDRKSTGSIPIVNAANRTYRMHCWCWFGVDISVWEKRLITLYIRPRRHDFWTRTTHIHFYTHSYGILEFAGWWNGQILRVAFIDMTHLWRSRQ